MDGREGSCGSYDVIKSNVLELVVVNRLAAIIIHNPERSANPFDAGGATRQALRLQFFDWVLQKTFRVEGKGGGEEGEMGTMD